MFHLSFRARLIVAATLWITAGLGGSWFALSALIRNHVAEEFLEELDHHASELAALVQVTPEGRPTLRQPLSDHRFFEPRSGYYWQVELASGNFVLSPSLEGNKLRLTADEQSGAINRPINVPGPTGTLLLLQRAMRLPGVNEPLYVAVGTNVNLVDELLSRFNWMLAASLGAIAVGLIAAIVAQVSFGLWPLNRIRKALGAIHRGEINRLPTDLPSEVKPLVESLNGLLVTNEEVVRRARAQAGNLAHALKTPIAILIDEARRLAAKGQDGDVILTQCERMRRQIDYQLAHARAAASRGKPAASVLAGPAIEAILAAVRRLYRERSLDFESKNEVPDAIVACEAEDFDEMLGNLVENAAKWAKSRVRVAVSRGIDSTIQIDVEDDGPGMPEDARERVFEAGERLDEQVPGSGLGLAIVRDVAGVYGGRAWIGESALGGAAVHLQLPAIARNKPIPRNAIQPTAA